MVTDTAGMRDTLDPIEAEGVAVAHEVAQQADLVLSVLDCTTSVPIQGNETAKLAHASQDRQVQHPRAITVYNKADVLSAEQREQLQAQMLQQIQSRSTSPFKHTTANVTLEQRPYTASETNSTFGAGANYVKIAESALRENDPETSGALPKGLSPSIPNAVLCSCATGWNMDVLLQALEQSVQSMMAAGTDSQEGLVITR